jgi:RHS repeat-associated protein
MVRGICNAGRSHLCHLYDGQDAVRESGGTGAVAYLRALAIDEALTRTDPTSSRFYLGDALGSTVALTDATGATLTSYTYAPFGDTAITGSPTASPFQFTGRENDGTGLYYYRARYCDPVQSRFVSEDPIGLAGGINTYIYVEGNPLSYTDPLGLKTLQCTKPLNALKDKFGSGFSQFAHDYVPAAYHQYSSVVDKNGKETCGGQDHEGSPWRGPGKPSEDSSGVGQCKEIEPDNNCFEQCLITEWAKPRPTYGIPIGIDCQDYDNDVIKRCRKQCKK